MPFKRTSPIPRGATHIKLVTPEGKTNQADVKDIDWVFSYPFRVPGKLIFLKKEKNGFKELDSIEFDGVWPPRQKPQVIT
jgi:hypothetical protein|tara:strand:+ start:598 stop:837 length:240 start_codon:yes stop_codon:yes gene_type:complete